MLITLTMKKWRKHVDKVINFTSGLNAVRGANENGKTSMLWAIAYALWGAKALPLPMDEMVTWGHPTKEAKVELIICVGGEMYLFCRSTAGAECRHSGGIVTGQNEVTKFATELLGVDADLAMKLMFAPQGDLRGALKAGPTAISSYIEDMSGMDLFERLLDLISEKLPTGPTTRLDGEIAELECKLERGGPQEPDVSDINMRIAGMTDQLRFAESMLPAAEQKAQEATDAYSKAQAEAAVHETSVKNLNAAKAARDRAVQAKAADKAIADNPVNEARIAELEKLVADAQALQATKTAYAAFRKVEGCGNEWEGDEASLKAEIVREANRMNAASQKVSELTADIREAQAKLVTSSVCGYCNQDFSQFPEVAKKNADLQTQIAEKEAIREKARAEAYEASEAKVALQEVLDSTTPFHAFLQKYGQYVTVDNGFVPPHLGWNGTIPTEDINPAGLQSELAALKKSLTAHNAAVARLEQADQIIAEHEATIERLSASISEPVDLDALYQVKFAADTAHSDWAKGIQKARADIQTLESNKSRIFAEYELAKRDFANVAVALESKKKERDDLTFNNTLVKKVKAARPIVASKLWSLVLSSVSVMFSNMRGEQSIVTKGPKGFLVNDRPAESLSGSALDLLGFAIRVAMLKTFIPDCSFLILDEATAACDDDRTASLLGFIAGAGFPQTLLVTHEISSESVADNVVVI